MSGYYGKPCYGQREQPRVGSKLLALLRFQLLYCFIDRHPNSYIHRRGVASPGSRARKVAYNTGSCPGSVTVYSCSQPPPQLPTGGERRTLPKSFHRIGTSWNVTGTSSSAQSVRTGGPPSPAGPSARTSGAGDGGCTARRAPCAASQPVRFVARQRGLPPERLTDTSQPRGEWGPSLLGAAAPTERLAAKVRN